MLTIDFINVGYGDAILIRHQSIDDVLKTILIDGGDSDEAHYAESTNRIKCIDYLHLEKVHSIDLLVLTHLHKDHVGGLAEVVADLPVKEAWINVNLPEKLFGVLLSETTCVAEAATDVQEGINTSSKILKLLHQQGTAIKRMTKDRGSKTVAGDLIITHIFGKKILYDRQDDIIAELFAGSVNREPLLLELHGFINNTSTVLKVIYHNVVILFAADVYATFWQEPIASQCQLLKLPHHGHKDCMTPELARAFSPEHVVISVSDSRTDDCPSLKALEAFLSCDHTPQFCCTDALEIKNYCKRNAHQAVRYYINEKGSISKEFVIREPDCDWLTLKTKHNVMD